VTPQAPGASDQRRPPEEAGGAGPADGANPEFSRGQPLDDPQPSAPGRKHSASPQTHARTRASIHALLEGVPLPATKADLVAYARREGGRSAAKILRRLPSQRYGTLDEVGEALEPVQPQWPRVRRVPKAESDLPPGGSAYGINPNENGAR
jgi:hypothetical protein